MQPRTITEIKRLITQGAIKYQEPNGEWRTITDIHEPTKEGVYKVGKREYVRMSQDTTGSNNPQL